MILCEQHIFSYYTNCIQAFSHLSVFILSGENGKSLCKSCNFLGYLTATSGYILYRYLRHSFL